MAIQMLLLLLPVFFIGGICNELRWIARMRRLRGKLSLAEAAKEYAGEHARSEAPTGFPAPLNMHESLLNLQQTLSAETAPARLGERSEISKS